MIIVNLFPVAKGGGLQNAFSLLTALKKSELTAYQCLVRKGSDLELYCQENDIKFESFGSGLFGRLLFEFFYARRVCLKNNAKVIFTLFGNCPILSGKSIKISGFARSNVVEKDKKFWNFLPRYKRMIKRINDLLILQLMKLSDVVILETERLGRLSSQNKVFGDAKVRVVKMAASGLIVDQLGCIETVKLEDMQTINITYITGSHPNKNIPLLAPLFHFLNINCLNKSFNLICTLPNDDYFMEVKSAFNRLNIEQHLTNGGFLSSNDIPKIISESHALINVAYLESFSNNWVESWAAKRLLICRDAEYAHDSCFDSAIYVDLNEPEISAKKILTIFESQAKFDQYTAQGSKLLEQMPNSNEKFQQYMEIINEFL